MKNAVMYLLCSYEAYESDDIYGIFSSLEKAMKASEKIYRDAMNESLADEIGARWCGESRQLMIIEIPIDTNLDLLSFSDAVNDGYEVHYL